MSDEEMAPAVRDLRVALGLTQEDLARALGVALSTVCRWEQGRSCPSRLAMASLQRLRTEASASADRPRQDL
jgi:DNA-binding transcriptional regulator YiaG